MLPSRSSKLSRSSLARRSRRFIAALSDIILYLAPVPTLRLQHHSEESGPGPYEVLYGIGAQDIGSGIVLLLKDAPYGNLPQLSFGVAGSQNPSGDVLGLYTLAGPVAYGTARLQAGKLVQDVAHELPPEGCGLVLWRSRRLYKTLQSLYTPAYARHLVLPPLLCFRPSSNASSLSTNSSCSRAFNSTATARK